MTDTGMTNAQTVVQLASLVAIVVPIVAYIGYWVWMTTPERVSNGRQKYWYMLYAAVGLILLVS